MPLPNKKVFFADYIFNVSENVYEPSEDSFFFAENLVVKECESILDMGTGCGILGIIAAEKAEKVVAVDINPYAVRCAKENAKLNCVADKMYFVQGDLFASIKTEKEFDLILFNAPYLPIVFAEDKSWLEIAWAGGVNGRQVISRFIYEAPKYLKEDGRILLMQSSLSDVNATLKDFAKRNLKASVITKRDLPLFETITLIEAKHDFRKLV